MRERQQLTGTVKKSRHVSRLSQLSNYECQQCHELEPHEVKLLLGKDLQQINPLSSRSILEDNIKKQELLQTKNLFNPYRYFGSASFDSIRETNKFHQSRLDQMFTHKEKVINKENLQANIQDEHLSSKDKAFSCKDKGLDAHAGPKFSRTKQPSKVTQHSGGDGYKKRDSTKLGKSPKRIMQSTKEEYLLLNIKSLQKVRVKLKLTNK